MAISKPIVAFLMVNIAMLAFTSAAITPTCPDLNVCANIANNLLNVQFGSQARSECCVLLNGLVDADAAVCLCTSLKTTNLGGVIGSALGLLGNLTGSILDKELLAIFNACGLNSPINYHCV